MVGVWFLEKARERKDRKKGELRSEGQKEKSTVIVRRRVEPLPVVAVMFEDGVTRVVGHKSCRDQRERELEVRDKTKKNSGVKGEKKKMKKKK